MSQPSSDDDVESRSGTVDGLALLPVRTVFGREKVLARPTGTAGSCALGRLGTGGMGPTMPSPPAPGSGWEP